MNDLELTGAIVMIAVGLPLLLFPRPIVKFFDRSTGPRRRTDNMTLYRVGGAVLVLLAVGGIVLVCS